MSLVELGERWNGREVDGGGEEGLGRGRWREWTAEECKLESECEGESGKGGRGGETELLREDQGQVFEAAQYLPQQHSKSFKNGVWIELLIME